MSRRASTLSRRGLMSSRGESMSSRGKSMLSYDESMLSCDESMPSRGESMLSRDESTLSRRRWLSACCQQGQLPVSWRPIVIIEPIGAAEPKQLLIQRLALLEQKISRKDAKKSF